MDDSSNGKAVVLYPEDPGSNPRSGFIWDYFVSATRIIGFNQHGLFFLLSTEGFLVTITAY